METATCGSEHSLPRTYVEQILDLQITLRCLGVTIQSLSYMFEDINTVTDNSMTPCGKTNKRHVALPFHRAREVIAAKSVNYLFINRKVNLSDVLTKQWNHHDIFPTLNPILFWSWDTMECFTNNSLIFEDGE